VSRPDEKPFDCLEFKREVQARIFEETRELSTADLREYFLRNVEEGPFAEYFRSPQSTRKAA
jgi:hypothetical protein